MSHRVLFSVVSVVAVAVIAVALGQYALLSQLRILTADMATLRGTGATPGTVRRTDGTPTVPAQLLEFSGFTRGSPSAKVGLVEFSDFKCPFCGEFVRDTLPALERAYVDTGKVRIAFKFYPLDMIHPDATKAAAAAQCAGDQGQFWQMHDSEFADQRHLAIPDLIQKASALGVEMSKFTKCLSSAADVVGRDVEQGRRLGIRGTPTFIVGTFASDGRLNPVQVVSGAKSLKVFQLALDSVVGAQHP